jgi:hypothetical protein
VYLLGAPFFFKLWGIPFVLVGFYMIIGRFFMDAKKRANTVYGITQDRILIKSGIFTRDIQSLNIKKLPEINLSQKSDNSGTITFGPTYSMTFMMQRKDSNAANQVPCLEFIDDVKEVYDKIIVLQTHK